MDGDTGWQHGRKWRLASIDTPELASPDCDNERRLAIDARDRLQAFMSSGYRIRPIGSADRYGRTLVAIELSDGRDAGQTLLNEGLAQAWPNNGNVWCGR